ncbi:MAG: hypothetical protein HKN16_04905 [Saprospiraceae bacterium]|nr:hypothetical protein [Saprospiraceae bacterium]
MKLSTDLLKAIAVGVTIGATVSSCTYFEEIGSIFDEPNSEERAENNTDDPNQCWDCPACGLG